ncbi:unnamed protein product [Durusdinium trenchii]|uniref:Uncharacterized protein n=1 Tax=Durusdinium trenchii TaxID=1381693 RepID=A0ABP0IV25_9DINO
MASVGKPSQYRLELHYLVSNVTLVDLDLDAQELGGVISWHPPEPDVSLVETYSVYLAEDAVGANRTVLSNLAAGTNQLSLAADFDLAPGLTHILVYTRSALFEQSSPAVLNVLDANVSVFNVSITDIDLDDGEAEH